MLGLWGITVASLCLLWAFLTYRFGAQKALGATILLSMAVPTWVTIDLAGNPLDVRVAVTAVTLILYCFQPSAVFPWRLGWLDISMLLLMVVHIVSDVENSGWNWFLPLTTYAEWGLPYIAGRLALRDLENFEFLAPVGLSIGIVMAAGSIWEALTWTHPWEWIYGERHLDGIPRNAQRWGLLRAWGCCAHPIFFGMLQLSFLPWALRAFSDASSGYITKWAWLLPSFFLAGIAATGSRAALAGGLIMILISLLVLVPRSRIAVGIAVPLLIGFFAWQDVSITDFLRKWGDERVSGKVTNQVIVGDEEVEMSGTLSRLHVLRMYRRAVMRGGLIGFGSERTTGFPVNVPLGAEDESAMKKIRFIDNEFLLITLRFGWLGLFFFSAALFQSVVAWFMRAREAHGLDRDTAIFFANCVLATAIALSTVWMPHDIGFPLLWMMGAASSSFRDQGR